jgi:tellurite methyltransferase
MSDADRERWDARWREKAADGDVLAGPAAFVTGLAPLLPARGRALDVAGGAGRHALWLARRGLDVTLADISPVACELARRAAAAAGVALACAALDLERDAPGGPWDVVLVHHYLDRALLPRLARALAPGGLLAFAQPTRRNLERHDHPSARFLLEEGELARLAAGLGLELLVCDEAWRAEGRHEAWLVGRQPAALK